MVELSLFLGEEMVSNIKRAGTRTIEELFEECQKGETCLKKEGDNIIRQVSIVKRFVISHNYPNKEFWEIRQYIA